MEERTSSQNVLIVVSRGNAIRENVGHIDASTTTSHLEPNVSSRNAQGVGLTAVASRRNAGVASASIQGLFRSSNVSSQNVEHVKQEMNVRATNV